MTWERESDEDGETIDPSAVPKPLRYDITTLTLGRVDAFLLSQVDGSSSVDDLASLTGMPLADAAAGIARLASLGVVKVPGVRRTKVPPAPGGRKTQAPAARKTQVPAARKTQAPAARRTQAPPARKTQAPAARKTQAPPARKTQAPGARKTHVPPARRTEAPPPRKTKTPPPRKTGSHAARRTIAPLRPTEELSPDAVPRLRATNRATLDIGAKDAFVLSQVDGATRISEIASIVGMDESALGTVLRRLEAAGAIDFAPPPRRASAHPATPTAGKALSIDVFDPRRARQAVPPKSTSRSLRAAAAPSARPSAHEPPRSQPKPTRRTSPPKAKDETIDLPPELAARIDELHGRLGTATYYELLDVSQSADKKIIKKAYFAFVSTMHPDRHWKKKLGPFGQKLQDVFVRVTLAHDTLARPSTREAYDRTLGLTARAERPETRPAAPPPAAPAVRVAPLETAEARAPETSEPPKEAKRARIRVPSARFRAGALRVRVASVMAMPSAMSPSASPALPAAPASSAAAPGGEADDNRRHARMFVAAAERELSNGNVVAAAAQFKLALSCCEMPNIRKAYEAVEGLATARMFEAQKAQGETAEREARWPDAVAAYTRAHASKPDPRVGERLANALRLSKGDLRLAAKLAEEAVTAEPQNGSYHATLGEVYADAGLEIRAEAEARRALELLPADARAQALGVRFSLKRR